MLTNQHDQGTVRMAGSQGEILAGGFGANGSLELRNAAGRPRIEADADAARIRLRRPPQGTGLSSGPPSGPITVEINGDEATVSAGVSGHAGTLVVQDEVGNTVLELNGAGAEIVAGAADRSGRITVKNREGTTQITLNGQSGQVSAETGRFRNVSVIDDGGLTQIQLDGNDATIRCGRQDQAGRIELRSASGEDTIVLNGATGNVGLGRDGNAGALFVKGSHGEDTIVLNGATGATGNDGNAGVLFVKDSDGKDTIVLNGVTANIGLGRNGKAGGVFVKDSGGKNTIHLSGETGDIILMNADCAEEFEVDRAASYEPGTVMVIDEGGRLRRSEDPYDTRVAGVISGAGDYRPGILLGRQGAPESRVPVALVGKVFCKVDASYGPIRVGDLLTTSGTPGHAMRASNSARTPGAVIGKALRSFQRGQGLIPILVALQ
jgi:hypothetical protein